MNSLKQLVSGRSGNASLLTQLMVGLGNDILGRELLSEKVNLSSESMTDVERDYVANSSSEIMSSIEAVTTDLGFEADLTDAQRVSAVYGGLIASDTPGFLNREIRKPVSTGENVTVFKPQNLSDAQDNRTLSYEVYDERENKEATIYSVSYNLQAPRQDDFGEAFFPTIACSPDEVGFGVEIELTMVYLGFSRKTSGALDDFKKKNILRAIADHTILKDELTRLVPVFRAGTNDDKFIDVADLAAANFDNEGTTILTSALKPGVRLSLLGISQTQALLDKGAMDETDAVDPAVNLEYVYIRLGAAGALIRFPVEDLPLANFVYKSHGNYRKMGLDFDTTSLILEEGVSTKVDGTLVDDTTLTGFDGTAIKSVRLKVAMTGEIDLETSELVVWANEVVVDSARDGAGEIIPLDAGVGATLVGDFDGTDILGYKVKAYATNSNRRERGQILDVIRYTTLYNIPVRNPITAIHPVSGRYDNDTSDLAALISATRVRCSNSAVETLIRSSQTLAAYVKSDSNQFKDANEDYPEVLGTGRMLVRPTYFTEAVDVSLQIDSLRSMDRPGDIQAVLVNKIRDYAYEMYRDSEYKAAVESMNGGVHKLPTVIVGTDPVIARYLTVTGDSRTLGNDFKVKIVSTLDKRMEGKIFITFGVFDSKRNQEPNVLNFGNMGWCPEIPVVLPISRGGQISKELSVQPRFLHVVHSPILTVLNVSGIPNALDKVTVNVSQ